MAGGFRLSKNQIPAFEQFIALKKNKILEDDANHLNIDAIVSSQIFIDNEIRYACSLLKPFGPKNSKPLFVVLFLRLKRIHWMKNKHIRCYFIDVSGQEMTTIIFNAEQDIIGQFFSQEPQYRFHIACHVNGTQDTWWPKQLAFQIYDVWSEHIE
jgi:single-stranded DNA-specific DHH superfamily exonuclease